MDGGKSNHLDMIVDLGILSQSTKSCGIWLARERERERSTEVKLLVNGGKRKVRYDFGEEALSYL
jgi:hypothetical protein